MSQHKKRVSNANPTSLVTESKEEWSFLGTPKQVRYDPATVQLSDTEWWITG